MGPVRAKQLGHHNFWLALPLFLNESVIDFFLLVGAGHYSFYQNLTQTCQASLNCQSQIINIDSSSSVNIYGLSTIGATYQLSIDGKGIIDNSGLQKIAAVWSSGQQRRERIPDLPLDIFKLHLFCVNSSFFLDNRKITRCLVARPKISECNSSSLHSGVTQTHHMSRSRPHSGDRKWIAFILGRKPWPHCGVHG